MRAHKFYRQATVFDGFKATGWRSVDETVRRLMAVQEGKNPVLQAQIARKYLLQDKEQRKRGAREDAICNFAGILASMVSATDIQTLRIGYPSHSGSGASTWEFRSVDYLRCSAYGDERSKRCAERHLARAKSAWIFDSAERKVTKESGEIVSRTSIRWLTAEIFTMCGTFGLLKMDRRRKEAERAEQISTAAAARHRKYRSRKPAKRETSIGRLPDLVQAAVGVSIPSEMTKSDQEPPETQVKPDKKRLIALARAKIGDAIDLD